MPGDRRRHLLEGALLLTLLQVSACGDNDLAEQDWLADSKLADSVNASAGDLRLLAVRIEHPADVSHVEGNNIGLFLTIANGGESDDTLTAVSTVDAQQIVFRDGAGRLEEGINVNIPAGEVASMQYPGGPHLELVGLQRDVLGASFLPVTFRFAEAGAVTVKVFVQGFGEPILPPLPASPTASPNTS